MNKIKIKYERDISKTYVNAYIRKNSGNIAAYCACINICTFLLKHSRKSKEKSRLGYSFAACTNGKDLLHRKKGYWQR